MTKVVENIEKMAPRADEMERLRRELLRRIVHNEARRQESRVPREQAQGRL